MALTTLNVLTVLTALLLCAQGQVLRAGMAFNSRRYSSLLTVTNGERFGSWTWTETCPENFFAIGFSIRVESNQHGGDDTAMNGVRLFCAKDESRSLLYTIESHPGYFGDWTAPQYCPTGVLSAFQLRVEPHQGGIVDDTAVNNIRFRCSSHLTMEGAGMSWGEYGHWSPDCDGGICGVETKMEGKQGNGDDTTLNDVHFLCCKKSPQRSCTAVV